MKPVEFKGQNIVFGKDQPEYQPLPALVLPEESGQVITCWELSSAELEEVNKTGKIYVGMFTFNRPLMPLNVQASLDGFFDLMP
jgi:hypothetical protein